jgi:hypothetical protein
MTAPTDAPTSPIADGPADPTNISQSAEEPMQPVAAAPADPTNIIQPAEEPVPPPELGVEHVAPPGPEPLPVPVQPRPPDDDAAPADPVSIIHPAEESVRAAELVVQPVWPPTPALLPVPVQSGPQDDQNRPSFYEAAVESRAVLAHGIESLSEEFATLARQSIDTTAHAAIQMLGVKTWADAVAVNTRYARISCDHWLGGTLKVVDLGIKVAFEASRPFLSKFGKVWSVTHPGH